MIMVRFRLFETLISLGAILAMAGSAHAQSNDTTVFLPFISVPPPPHAYWGATVDGSTYGIIGQPPSNTRALTEFETHTGKSLSILHWEQRWKNDGADNPFSPQQMDTVREHGAISLLDWISEDNSSPNPDYNRPQFSLIHILDGTYDAYIRKWATDAKTWGHPFFLRFDYEMNGDWVAWSELVNGNRPGQYVQAWQHVHDIFTQVGASNVTWVWCPNVLIPPQYTIPMQSLYPGDAYVNWTCLDGYNWGTNPAQHGRWQTFQDVFQDSYAQLLQIAPDKPVMIGETASSEYGGSKADWINDALSTQLPQNFPQVRAFVWLNANRNGMDWVIESSHEAQAAFAASIGSFYYAANQYSDLNQSPIPPPS